MTEAPLAGTRRALVVASGHYRHPELPDLHSPARDAEAVRRVLGNPSIGAFSSVDTLVDPDVMTANNRIYDFFATAELDEFLFVYFSGHGRQSGNGRLHLTTVDSDPHRIPPTTVSADFIAEQFDGCRARQVVLVLDCCHAGAFGADPRVRGSRDRVVILTAGEHERAHEGEHSPFEAKPSRFAAAFFEGIETGRADNDDNGLITIREAFDYATHQLRAMNARQTPQMRAGVSGDLVLCRAPSRPGQLPPEIRSLVEHSLPIARQAGVDTLTHWLTDSDPARSAGAREALNVLRRDPDERVARAASALLARRSVEGSQPDKADAPVLDHSADPLWFQHAVLYVVIVRAFADGNRDGVGDLQGVAERLEYLQWLGVDGILLSPIFDSPLEDDGNDVSDFRAVHPDLGGISDLVELVDAAHRRGIRVLLDLVLNHTSNRHPWFEKSRRSAEGGYGDYYVWSDTDQHLNDGKGGWTYDPLRKQYYWHRFLSSEPDLNFDSPRVQDEMLDTIKFWLALGVDGFRLVSAPFLFEREGSGDEGLDETHAYLRRLRAEVDAHYPGRVLLAWADHWPSDAADYFGDPVGGPECNMVLYTSLMPRIFLSMRNASHQSVSSLLAQAHETPEGCQWGIYLRNGDEMALDTVDGDDHDYLLREYAPQARMRSEAGIRRRLAPLLDGDRRQLELCAALLLSLPGSPILYYGDEIGMGDNLMLAGRSAVRTPMQWSGDRGAGFSTADPDQFPVPVLLSAAYGHQAVNVDAQRGNPTSLLNLIRRLVGIRRHSRALSGGSFALVPSTNPAVLAYVRCAGEDTKLCVVNFSPYPQETSLDLVEYAETQLVETSGGARFSVVTNTPYPLALGPHGYLWFHLAKLRRTLP